MPVSERTYKEFRRLTNYNLASLVRNSVDWFQTRAPKLLKFYEGKLNRIEKIYQNELDSLEKETKIALGVFRDQKRILEKVEFWELLDGIEDILSKLQYYQNISKYTRSSIIRGKVKNGYIYNHVLGPEETMEDVSRNIQRNSNFQNAGQDIAYNNDLREVDWDIDGGTEVELVDSTFQSNLVTSMIDNTIGDRVYGKDLQRLIKFNGDDDLLVLDYVDSAKQAVDILSSLVKNDIPEWPSYGMDDSIWKGTNFSKINFPLISREMRSVFNTDDLFQDFRVLELDYQEGDLYIKYEVGTARGLVLINEIAL
jgi:hypothetical protein